MDPLLPLPREDEGPEAAALNPAMGFTIVDDPASIVAGAVTAGTVIATVAAGGSAAGEAVTAQEAADAIEDAKMASGEETHSGEQLATVDTELTADCVETLPPHLEANPEHVTVALGTYQLNKETRQREGRLHLMKVPHKADWPKYNQVEVHSVPALLDMKWCWRGTPTLALATATGRVITMALSEDQASFTETGHALFGDDALCLSVDWNNRVADCEPQIAVSLADGRLAIIKRDGAALQIDQQWNAHTLHRDPIEAWITAFLYDQPNLLMSGADDCLWKLWDLRAETKQPLHTSKFHSMGVCSAHSNPHNPFHFATGSYDEHVAVWDSRNLATPVTSFTVGGGIWRLKWHPEPKFAHILLGACTGAGFFVFDTTTTGVVCSYLKHASLAYGVDWIGPSTNQLVGSCSFYDHRLDLWRVRPALK